tara:strand:+ start:20552 stop:21613 length:1062 start_codon:yes stop_codon:yes gene_type:complete
MQKALYFMPDISGFTDFVNTTEIEHSTHIISELLEILLDANSLDLKLAEIEGDALFMYTTKPLVFQEILDQTHQMMTAFHTHTKMYENKRICNCGSCRTTNNLTLKFVVHYGNLNFIKVKNIIKPYGKDVIKTHRLLKNNIPLNEYLLITNAVYQLFQKELDTTWAKSSQIHDLQEVNYFYKNLTYIEKELKTEQKELAIEEQKDPKQSIQKTIDTNIDELYKLVSELKYRHLWDSDVKRIDFDENKINRVGTQHNCVLQFGNLNFETISEKSNDSLIYGEKTKDMMFVKDYHYIIHLEKVTENLTNLTLDLYLEFTTIGTIMKTNILKMLIKIWNKKLEKLNLLSIKQTIEN